MWYLLSTICPPSNETCSGTTVTTSIFGSSSQEDYYHVHSARGSYIFIGVRLFTGGRGVVHEPTDAPPPLTPWAVWRCPPPPDRVTIAPSTSLGQGDRTLLLPGAPGLYLPLSLLPHPRDLLLVTLHGASPLVGFCFQQTTLGLFAVFQNFLCASSEIRGQNLLRYHAQQIKDTNFVPF